jgi:outer membrane protein assembly factor BamD
VRFAHARLTRPFLLVALAGLLAGCAAGVIPSIRSEEERLTEGRKALERGEYNVAIELLKSYVANNAGGADVDRAIELLGESFLGTKQWAEAQIQFERLLRDYPESDSAAAASFHLGAAYWGQSRGPDFDQEYTRKALAQWESYLRSYRGHWRFAEAEGRVRQARGRLGEKLVKAGHLYIKLDLTRPARVYFRRVLEEYPDTPAVEEARLGLAMADARDGKRDEAMAALREVQSLHPGRPVAERAAKELARLERQGSKKN